MKSSTLIVWLMVAACIAIDLAMISELQVRRNETPEARSIIGFGLAFSQGCLVAAGLVWGTWNPLWRTVLALCAAWGLSFFISCCQPPRSSLAPGQWFSGLLIYLGVAIVPFAIAKCFGYTLTASRKMCHPASSRPSKPRQFTIWNLLSAMTATSVVLGVVRHVDLPSWLDTVEGVFIFTVIATTACAMLLVPLLTRRVWVVLVLGLVLCPSSAALLTLTRGSKGMWLDFLAMMGLLAISTSAAAGILLIGGHRLVRIRSSTLATASGASGVPASGSVDRHDEP